MPKGNLRHKRIEIIKSIIEKGGLYGRCAEFCSGDVEKSHCFIIECSEQCHHQSLIDFFGEELIMKIIYYVSENEKERIVHSRKV
jgi:hypothetical protein